MRELHNVAVHERIRTLDHGQHLCMLYEHVDDQLAVSTLYLAEGLRRGERCLYASDPTLFTALRGALSGLGVDVDGRVSAGALLLLTKEQAHLQGGGFDLQRMLALLEAAVHSAMAAGFRGLRAAGDMSWIVHDAPGTDQVAAYEAMMNEFYPRVPALGLCLYDSRRLTPPVLESALRTHPSVMIGQSCCATNPHYEPPDVFLNRGSARARFEWMLSQLTA